MRSDTGDPRSEHFERSNTLLATRYGDGANTDRAEDALCDGCSGWLAHVGRFIRMPGLIRLGVRSGW